MAKLKRRRKSFGGTKVAHRADAVRNANTLRFERKIVEQHLRAGECRPAINALVHMGMAAGKLIANRTWAGKSSTRAPRMTIGLRRLSEKVGAKCAARR